MSNQKNNTKRNIIVILILISVLILIYIATALYFKTHYFYGTIIENVPCGLMNQEEARKLIEDKVNHYELVLYGRENIEDSISAAEIDLELHFDDSFYGILSNQNYFGWTTSFFKNHSYELSRDVTYNEEKLFDVIDKLSFFDPSNIRNPKDAYIGDYDSVSGKYEIIEEYPGTNVDKALFAQQVKEAVVSLEDSFDLEQAACYKKPARGADDRKLKRLLDTINRYVSTKIIYDWNGDEVILDGQILSKWLSVQNNRIVLDEDLLEEWVTDQASTHDTYSNERDFVTYTGDVVKVKSSTFGWKTDKKAEIKELETLIRKGETVEREPEYTYRGYQKGQDDMGDSYVEINLSAQHLYLWMDGEVILETDFVSGNMSNGNATPPGLFGLTYKQKDAVLRGANYTTPVKYWMPFNGNVGMHDASWRKSFGGDIYLENGSHGCINLPVKMAEEIYGYMEKRFPIVCYY